MARSTLSLKKTPEKSDSNPARLEVIVVTPEIVASWKKPFFQRPVKVNRRVAEMAEQIKVDQAIGSMIYLGMLGHGSVPERLDFLSMREDVYLIDGQHRREAFRMSGIKEALVEVHISRYQTMAKMAEKYVLLQSTVNRMTSDDLLRALEADNQFLADIRKKCPFVGYSHVRQKGEAKASILLAMSVALRTWFGSASYCPTPGPSAIEAANLLDDVQVRHIVDVLSLCLEAWAYDKENFRLWTTVNLSLTFWLYRRLVLRQDSSTTSRVMSVSKEQFKQCLMAASANRNYVDWLLGRAMRDVDRSPAYGRLKSIFTARLKESLATGKPVLPNPDWAS